MGIPFTAEINPNGLTVAEKQENLIYQLRRQNEQLKRNFEDIDRQFAELKKLMQGEAKK